MKKALLKALVPFIALFVLLSGTLAVRADLIYTPDNDFFNQHRSEMEDAHYGYEANAPGGTLTLYKSPQSNAVVATVQNGDSLYGSYSWTASNGVRWIIVTWGNADGWAPYDYVWRHYDTGLFEEDYAASVKEESGVVNQGLKQGDTLKFYSYPGAAEAWDVAFNGTPEDLQYYLSFTDEAGRKWGKIHYYFGMKNYWVVLDDPAAGPAELYGGNIPIRDTRVKPDQDAPNGPDGAVQDAIAPVFTFDLLPLLVLILVIVVVLLSAAGLIVLLVLLKKRRKRLAAKAAEDAAKAEAEAGEAAAKEVTPETAADAEEASKNASADAPSSEA